MNLIQAEPTNTGENTCKRGHASQRDKRGVCRECKRILANAYYSKNRDELNARVRARYAAEPSMRSKKAASAKKYRSRDPEKLNAVARDRYFANRDKIAAQRKARHKSGYTRNYNLQRSYGLTLDQYKAMEAAQDGKCAICRVRASLVVDHCHSTGIVRGLLCSSCNKAIGFMRDDADRLAAAISYLKTIPGVI